MTNVKNEVKELAVNELANELEDAVLVNNVEVKEVPEKNTGFSRNTKIVKSNLNRSIKSLHKMWKKKELNFDLAIQRGEVWTVDQKTNLIYSILYGYYIPSVIAEFRANDTSIYFLDGKQRTSSIMRFIDGEWALSKSMNDIYGQSFAGFKFKDLPEEVQDMIYDETINIVKMENMTNGERDTQFVYLNMGSALTPIEKTRAMHSDLIEDINRLVKHSFFVDYMKAKKMVDQETLLQIAMLANDGKENIKGFGSAHIRDYVLKLKKSDSVISEEMSNRIEKTLDYLTVSAGMFTPEDDKKVFKKTHIPILFYVAEMAMKKGMKPEDFGDFIHGFLIENYSIESIYGQACQKSVTRKDNVLIRINEMTKAFETFESRPVVEVVAPIVKEAKVVEVVTPIVEEVAKEKETPIVKVIEGKSNSKKNENNSNKDNKSKKNDKKK